MKAEEAGAQEESQRDEEEPRVAAPPRRLPGRVGEDGVDRADAEDEPEVRGMVLPGDVEPRDGQEDDEPDERQSEERPPGREPGGRLGHSSPRRTRESMCFV